MVSKIFWESFPRYITFSKEDDCNFFIIISDNFFRDIYFTYKEEIKEKFGNRVFDDYKRVKSQGDYQIFVYYSSDETQSDIAFLAIKEAKLYQLPLHILRILGIQKNGLFSSDASLNALDLFLLSILYDPTFKTGMTKEEAYFIFNEVYFKKQGEQK